MTTPINDENAERVEGVAWFRTHMSGRATTRSDRIRRGHSIVNRLRDLGWEIEPPKPRFYADPFSGRGGKGAWVKDRNNNHMTIVTFWSDHPDTVTAAQAEATRLNEQVT